MSDDHKAPHEQLVNLLREEEENLVKRYLLGEADEREQQQVEVRLLTEDAYAESLVLIEDELIDDYARKLLSARDRELFERNFLTTSKRKQKLAVAQSLVLYAATENIPMPNREATTPEKKDLIEKTEVARGLSGVWRGLFSPPWKLAAFGFLLLVIGFGAWRIWFKPSEISPGLVALNQAYRQQRPLESRITGFDYAPFIVTRGDEKTGDYTTLDEAEVLLRKTAREKNDAESLRSLGRLYLAKKEFDKAIEQLDQALKALPATAPKDAQLHNDLGTALLEKSHISKRRGDEQQSALEIGRSLDELNKAVEANPNLLEAVFNRALCRQVMGLQNQAIAGWNEYLQKDSSSRWAEEARQHLQSIEEQRKKVAGMKDRAYDDFVAAYQTRDEAKAWEAFKIARNRNGSSITNRLIDDWMALVPGNQNDEAETKLRLLEFGGEIERTHTGEKFTTDQAAYYRQRATRNFAALTQARQIAKEAETTYNQAKLEAAHDLYVKASKLFRTAGNEPEALFCESWMGYCQTRLSDSAASISTFNRLIEKYKSHQYQNLLAYSFQSIADAYTTENKWSSAIENTNLSLSVLEKSDDWAGYFRSQATAASIRRILGMYKESLTANLLGISTAEQYPVEPRQVWNLYSSLSLNLLKLGHTQSAMDVQQEAHFLAKKVDWPLYQSLSHARQGMIQLELGNSEVAVELANQALIEASRIIDESTKTDTLADALFFKAHLLRRSGNYSEAVKNYELAIGLYEKTPYHLFSYKAYQGRFLARLALKDETNGEEDLEQAVALLEKFRGKILDENFRDSFFDESQEFYDTAINFEYVHRNNAIRAFQLSEDSRARSFLDSRQSSPHILKTDRSVDLQIQSLANPLSLGEIQQRLPEQTQIIQYSVLSEKIIIWIINSKSIFSAHQDISEKVLSEKIANFTTLVTASDESAIKQRVALSKELYNILIQPIESHLRQQELLCIVPDKQLNCLPFGALISASPGKYFIEDYTFVISPGATAFILCSETAKEKFTIAEERLLCLGNPKITNGEFSSLPNLRNAETEARQIAALYNSPHLLIGTEAKESLFAKLAPKIDVLHIAGHSIVDEASPLLSKLLLAADYPQNSNTESTDGILHLYELYQLRISKPKLVILSSCRTGRGRIYQSEGMVTLARPFLVAGVPTVISSLWDVDSEKTKELMIRFHTIRKRYRFSASKALRQAQLEMVCAGNNCPQSSLAWAAFNVVGGDYNVRF